MTEKEKYKQAFSTLHASDFKMEEIVMEKEKKRRKIKPPLVAAICLLCVVGSVSTIYAAREVIRGWSMGKQQDYILEKVESDDPNNQTYNYYDAETGEKLGTMGFAGYDREITSDDIREELNNRVQTYAELDEDGHVLVDANGKPLAFWVCYKDFKVNVADYFDEHGILRVKIMKDGEPFYIYQELFYRDGKCAGYGGTNNVHPKILYVSPNPVPHNVCEDEELYTLVE